MVVQTHRDPAVALPSLESLLYSLHSLLCADVDVPRLAESSARWIEAMVEGSARGRAVARPGQILDVAYPDLVTDPIGTVRGIHRHFDLPFDDAFEARLHEQTVNRPKDKFGRHEYSNAEFGTTDEAVRQRFAGYIDAYL